MPSLAYDNKTGFLYLTDGRLRQKVCRIERFQVWLWNRPDKKECPFALDQTVRLLGGKWRPFIEAEHFVPVFDSLNSSTLLSVDGARSQSTGRQGW
jgi:hypothetical protein